MARRSTPRPKKTRASVKVRSNDPLSRAQRWIDDQGERPTRERVLDAAMQLFHAQGYTATGIAAILERADLNPGSLFHFFPTKEDLVLALLDRYLTLLDPMVIAPVFERITDPIERVFGILDGYRRMLVSTECALGCPIGNLALELSDTHPKVRAKVAANFDQWCAAVRGCLDAGRNRLPPKTDTDRLATFVLTVMEGAVMQAKAQRSLDPYDQSVAELRAYFDRLLAEASDWKKPRSS
ncbi:MAG: TetR/AcrR family transcriptional regulator [Planctomycetes bacterium]|nr:TetR/AcrR family transcriptional regulator [Planctomycetota bacterium]